MSEAVLLIGFALLFGAMGVLETLARLGSGGGRRASFADVIDVAVRHPAGRVAALLCWLWTGWHLFVR